MHLLNLIRSGRPNLFDTITAPITLANDDYLADYLSGFGYVAAADEALFHDCVVEVESVGIMSGFHAGMRAGVLAAFGEPDSLPQLAEGLGLV